MWIFGYGSLMWGHWEQAYRSVSTILRHVLFAFTEHPRLSKAP